jgi:CHRD domain
LFLNLQNFIMKRLINFLAIATLLTVGTSCDKDDTPAPVDPNVTYKATLTGAQEATPNASTNTGSATLVFNTTTKIFTITVTHTVPTPTAAHIHKGAVGVAGGVIFGFTNPVTSPISYTSVALDAVQEADLVAGLYYVNVHSATPYTAGEIRGQLIKQ